MNRRSFAEIVGLASFFAAFGSDPAGGKRRPSLLLPNRTRVYEIGHGEASILAGAAQTDGEWWLANIRSDPGRKTSLHVHFAADEYLYVLEGRLSVWVDHSWHDLPADAVAAVPRGSPHALGNRSAQSMRYLVAGTPAGFEGFFADIEVTSRRFPYGSADFLGELSKIYAKYNSRLLDPPPQD